jgi:menaquinone-9 beta-reductase
MKKSPDIVIVGAGLAGLTAAIDLTQRGFSTVLIEKKSFPHHKVCGEFISNEVVPYFKSLGIDLDALQPTQIDKTSISLSNGKSISCELPLGGFGISRYTLDNYLYNKAKSSGCEMIHEKVFDIQFEEERFKITTELEQVLSAKIVLGAFGKRSNLDKSFQRNFIQKKSPWLGVKTHYSGNFPNDLVALYNFEGGYCGISKVENNIINICYLTKYDTFKKFKNIDDFNEVIINKNPNLKAILASSNMLFEKPLTISQISFEKKKQVEHHVLMIGDAAGLIHPLCGNGMAMAIHSAKLASEQVTAFLKRTIDRTTMEQLYQSKWNEHFKSRLLMGKWLSKVLLSPYLSGIMFRLLLIFPDILPKIIKRTHGNPIVSCE